MNDEDIAAVAMTLDPTRSQLLMFVGMKGRGKSEAARVLFDGWPYDRVVIDPTGDAQPDDPLQRPLTVPFPSQLPEPGSDGAADEEAEAQARRVTVWARIDPRSPTFEYDQDQAMGMALHPRHTKKLIWRDEFHLGTSPSKVSPNDRAALYSSRHYFATLLLVTQRPRWIPTITIGQTDKIFVFYTPNPDDREYIAKNAGVSVPVFERAYHANQRRHQHAFLLVDRQQNALIDCPPLPLKKVHGPAA